MKTFVHLKKIICNNISNYIYNIGVLIDTKDKFYMSSVCLL